MSNSFHGIFFLLLHLGTLFQPFRVNFPRFVYGETRPSPTPSISPTLTPPLTFTPSPAISISPPVTPSPTLSPTPTPTEPELTSVPSVTPTLTPSATPSPTPEPIGNDISYPQCGKSYPTGALFGIVGVNGGISTTTNPCLSDELSWAKNTLGGTTQPKIQLYVNTANPGGLNTASWPHTNVDPGGTTTNNPYGTCDGSDSLSCAWQYGWNRVYEDIHDRFTPAAINAGVSADPASYRWFLDVETVNTWKDGSDSALQSNAADLEGMVAHFSSRHIPVGLYSTSYQWGLIAGTPASDSSLNGLPSWLPGASTLDDAKANCTKPALTTGGMVMMTQYTTGEFDYDYSCM